MPIIVVEPLRWSRSPIQSFFLVLIALTGLLIVLNLSDNAITDDMGEPWASIWGICLVVGSLVSLLGSYFPNKLTGMFIERSGVLLLGSASALWPILIVIKLGIFRSPFTVVATSIFAVTCFLQVRYINKHINLIIAAITEGRPPQDE
jgi:hypothetical protein